MIKSGINGKINSRMKESHNIMFTKYIRKGFNYTLLAFIPLVFMSLNLQAAHQLETPLSLVTEHRPPFQFMKNGEVTGFSTQIINAMIKHTPYQAKTIIYPWSRAYNLALKKDNTCIYAIARTPERENNFKWIQAYFTTNTVFIGLKSSSDIKINNVKDAKNYRVAVLRDDVTHQLLVKHGFIENKNMFIVNNSSSMLKLLKSRDLIDLVLTDELSLKYRARYHDIDPNLFSSIFKLNDHPLEFYLACSLNTEQAIVNDMINGFNKIKQTGEYNKIMDEWLKAEDFSLNPVKP